MNKEYGAKIISWKFADKTNQDKKKVWFMFFGIISLLFILFSLIYADYMFAILILFLVVIYFIMNNHESREIEVIITNLGVVIDNIFTPFSDMRSFWVVILENNFTKIYFSFRKRMKLIYVPIETENINTVKNTLKYYIPEEKGKKEPLSDTIIRKLSL